tara:strand:+ start:9141 stop:9242 length:102 start_codon:yes stop_codon:yes gene_type:complete
MVLVEGVKNENKKDGIKPSYTLEERCRKGKHYV